jgi:hypothetical protein
MTGVFKIKYRIWRKEEEDIKINYKRKIVMSFVLILEIEVKRVFLNIFFLDNP